ncbi:MAG: methyltransferase domain-containing protein [Alphaproteobacteria bacterium]|nr:methyltransferase domain-containing protein [Alphaproteobacteria bacterium]
MTIEKMDDFFAKRVDAYESHMLNRVEGCREGYEKIAELVPSDCKNLLDLGCGTGLELKLIFEKFPNLHVVGVDYTQAMLNKLRKNYPQKNIDLICGDYFKVDFGKEKYDCAISFQTMHHFSSESKLALYKKIHESLKPSACYIECDYIAEDLKEEKFLFAEAEKMRKEENISSDMLIHLDTPCCVETQLRLFSAAGFAMQEKLWQSWHTAIFKADVL